ncbi:MAG: ABC transporter ATP-binding protein [Moheibacter sp.]
MTDELLKIENLSVGYSKPVCSQINAAVGKGELIGLTGKNGSGKSTLIRSILGLQPILSGHIKFLSEDMGNWDLTKRSHKISVVFSRLSQLPALTVFDLAALGRLPYSNGFSKLKPTEIELIDESLEKVGIADLKYRFVNKLSDGQLQMVMIARALVQDTDLIIMDEPTSHLDIENQFKIFELIYKLSRKTNKTFIVATHQIELILQNASRLWWIDNGNFHEGFPEQLAYEQQIYEKLAQKRIRFDYETGSFQFQYPKTKKVQLSGDGSDLAYWVKHALERNGFEISDESQNRIEIENQTVSLNNTSYQSIGELMKNLNNEN